MAGPRGYPYQAAPHGGKPQTEHRAEFDDTDDLRDEITRGDRFEKAPRGVGSEPEDRQDWQRISGKMRRKSMPVLSVPGALVGGDEVTMAVFHELSRAEGQSQQSRKSTAGSGLRTRGQTGLAANFRQNAPEIHASLVSPGGLPWPAGGVADFQDGGEADSDGFRLRDHAFDAVQQNLRGTGADIVGGLNHGGDRRREQIVHGELVEGGEGDIARRLQAAIAKGAQDAEGGGAVGAEDGIRAGGGIRELRAADDAYVLGTEIA